VQHYRYDGSFEGFLCVMSHCLANGSDTVAFLPDTTASETGLFQDMSVDVATDRDKAIAFRERFVTAVSAEAFAMVRYAFHSERHGIEQQLWNYVRLGLKAGPKLCSMMADKRVNNVDRLARSVSREVHKYKGFVRFREVEQGFLYARVEPEADILCFLAPHFVQRIGNRPWMIHDLRRSRAAVYDLKTWRLLHDIALTESPEYTEAEHECTGLWQRYFQSLAIKARHNPKLQQQHVPLRSRKHMVEFDHS